MSPPELQTIRLESEICNLYFWALPWRNRSKLQMSIVDLHLRRKWEAALDLQDNLFLHGVESEPHRMHGHKGFVAMLCRSRASRKRKPQSFTSILQEADPNSFNFTKVKPAEVLFQIEDEENGHRMHNNTSTSAAPVPKHETSVVINNSPYEYAHCLLVPNLHECRIQSITLNAIKMGIKVLLSSAHPGFRLMYNSLCAGASINHLHLHCYYTEYWLPSEAFQMSPILLGNIRHNTSDLFELDFNDTGVRGFGFVITPENYQNRLPIMVHAIVQYFNNNNIAHNIVIMRGLPPSSEFIPDDVSKEKLESQNSNQDLKLSDILENPNIPTIEETIPYSNNGHIPFDLKTSPLIGRLYIFPRLPLYGEKCYRSFLVNVTELFGHLYFGDVDVYESMDESDVTKALNNISFSEQQFNEVKNDITEILSNL